MVEWDEYEIRKRMPYTNALSFLLSPGKTSCAAMSSNSDDDSHSTPPPQLMAADVRDDGETLTFEDSCLEGNLKMRKGRATGNGSIRWKEHFVHLRFNSGGSIYVYEGRQRESSNNHQNRRFSELHEEASTSSSHLQSSKILVFISSDLRWVVKDIRNS